MAEAEWKLKPVRRFLVKPGLVNNWGTGMDACRSALQELVALKNLNDAIEAAKKRSFTGGKVHTAESAAMFDEYRRRKPLAWEAARAALSEAPQYRQLLVNVRSFLLAHRPDDKSPVDQQFGKMLAEVGAALSVELSSDSNSELSHPTERSGECVQAPVASLRRVGWVKSTEETDGCHSFLSESIKTAFERDYPWKAEAFDTPVFVQLYDQAELDVARARAVELAASIRKT